MSLSPDRQASPPFHFTEGDSDERSVSPNPMGAPSPPHFKILRSMDSNKTGRPSTRERDLRRSASEHSSTSRLTYSSHDVASGREITREILVPTDISFIVFDGSPSKIADTVATTLGISGQYTAHLKENSENDITPQSILIQPGLAFPHHLSNKLKKAKESLLLGNSQSAPQIFPKSSCCTNALKGIWEHGSGILSLGYGAIFALMAFAMGNTPITKVILAVACIFAFWANFLQADDSVLNLGPGIHKKISSMMGEKTPDFVKIGTTVLTLMLLFYLLTLPGAALIFETVDQGLLSLSGNTAHNIPATFEQIVRAIFAARTLATALEPLEKRKAIAANESMSSREHTMADWALPISLAVGAGYGYLTFDKLEIALQKTPLRLLYPEGSVIDALLLGSGTLTNSIVAGKLFLAGLLSLVKEVGGRGYKASLALSGLACGAGVATGLSTGLSSYLGAQPAELLFAIFVLLFNFVYAAGANLPFFMEGSGATKLAILKEHLTALESVTPLFSTSPEVIEYLESVKNLISLDIVAIHKTSGVKALLLKLLDPFKRMVYGVETKQSTTITVFADSTLNGNRSINNTERTPLLLEV